MALIMTFIGLVIVMIVGILAGIYLESSGYNDGVCPVCGKELRHFDTDSQGSRGYSCDNCNYTAWVSYSVVDKDYK